MKQGQVTPETHRDAIVVVAMALLVLGLVAVASAKASLSKSLLDSLSWHDAFGRQAFFVLAGGSIMIAVSRLSPRLLGTPSWQRIMAISLGVVTLLGLVLPLIPGLATAHRGSHRWLQVHFGSTAVNVQPSEFAKLALVVFLAWWATRRGTDLRSLFKGFLPVMVAVGVCAALVAKEDVGTAALFSLVAVMLLVVAGCRLHHVGMAGLLGLGGLAYMIASVDYRWERIVAYRNLTDDPLGASYQPLQSLTAIASGGWFGVGLGAGIQKHGYLPENHTDFIFSTICEEMGLFGGFVIIGLFVTLVWLGLVAMRRAATGFERLAAFGLTALIGWQAVMNIAVVTVLVPTTGISLPLVSAGGSGILVYSVAIGLLAAIAFRSRANEAVKQRTRAGAGAIRFGTSPAKASAS